VQYVAEGTDEEESEEDAAATAEEHAEAARFAESARNVEYDETLAKRAFVYAQAAYYPNDPAACIRAMGHRSFRLHHKVAEPIFDGSTLNAYTGVDKQFKRVVVAFHGDVSIPGLARRLYKGKPVKVKNLCKGCKTHKYLAMVNSKICPEVIASVRTLTKQNPEFEVWITGHGFGGALASLCGYELEMARVFGHGHRRSFVTYGQPRVGNCHWARKFNQIFPTAIRVTHGDDPVPHIAPCHADPKTQRCIEVKDRKKRLWAFHNPTQVWYPSEMPTLTASEEGSFQLCKGSNWGEDTACRTHPLGFSMADHDQYFGVSVATNCARILDALPAADTVKPGASADL